MLDVYDDADMGHIRDGGLTTRHTGLPCLAIGAHPELQKAPHARSS